MLRVVIYSGFYLLAPQGNSVWGLRKRVVESKGSPRGKKRGTFLAVCGVWGPPNKGHRILMPLCLGLLNFVHTLGFGGKVRSR